MNGERKEKCRERKDQGMEGENRERKRREEREGENLSKLLFWGKECDPFLRVHGVWVAKDL